MNTLELKLAAPDDRLESLRHAAIEAGARQVHWQVRHFDTADGLLARHGISLRIRRDGGGWVQTLTALRKHSGKCLEHNVVATPTAEPEPGLDVARHAGHPSHQRLSQVIERAERHGGTVVLAEVYRTDHDRLTWDIEARETRITAALDIGVMAAAGRTRSVHELRLELQQGSAADLLRVAQPWVERHGLWIDAVSDAERGRQLFQGEGHVPPTHAAVPDAVPRQAARFAQAAIASCLDQVLRNASEVARHSDDPDHVHQTRVGLRRLRTALRELRPLDPRIDPQWEDSLAVAFRALGVHRDAALIDRKTTTALSAAGGPPLRAAQADAVDAGAPAATVRSEALQRTLLALLAYTQEDADPQPADGQPADAIEVLADRLDKHQQKLRKAAKRFAEMDAEERHSVRKGLKRLRYLAEFVAPAFRKSKVASYFGDIKPAQDVLGELNDAATAIAHFRTLAPTDPQAWFAVGWLTARQEHAVDAAAKALRTAGKADPFWVHPAAR